MRSRMVTLEAVGSWGGRLPEALPASEAISSDDATDHAHSCDAAYFVADGSYNLEAFLDPPADQFKFLRGRPCKNSIGLGGQPMSHFDGGNIHSTHPIVKSIGRLAYP